MVDYSRWDKIVEDEEKQEQSAKLVSDMLKIQKEKPEEIEKMKLELERMKSEALKAKQNLHTNKKNGSKAVRKTLNAQADVMRNELERLRLEQEKMDAKQKELERLASAGDGRRVPPRAAWASPACHQFRLPATAPLFLSSLNPKV